MPKNQHAQRKPLYFEKLSKSAEIVLSKSIFYVKNRQNLKKKKSFKKSEKQRVHKTTARGRSRVVRLNPQIGSGFGPTNLNKSPKCRRSLFSMDALMALEFMMLCYFFKDKYDDRREKATCLRHSKKLPPCPIHFRSSVVNSFIGKGAKS